MADELFRQVGRKTWYKWSIYVNVILFFIIGLFLYLLVVDTLNYVRVEGDTWLYITRDIAAIAIALALIFFQLIRNIFIIMRRSL
ncbi:MAG: hypothetical protein AYK22_08975 [Thermoplasmatales archaeon SG8-52-3]|nr:MAG: hypothetical protein AYK22_08975 [Thermoplasmatales archaeon SG8-52-3]